MIEKYLPYGRQWITENDIQAVVETLRGDWITQGPKVAEFEEALAAYCGAKYAVAVSSGTAALHLATLVANFGPGDEVITSPITFVATANSVLYTGAKPVFADIDPQTICMDPAEVEERAELDGDPIGEAAPDALALEREHQAVPGLDLASHDHQVGRRHPVAQVEGRLRAGQGLFERRGGDRRGGRDRRDVRGRLVDRGRKYPGGDGHEGRHQKE